MKHYSIFLATTALALASLACQAVPRGRSDDNNAIPPAQDSIVTKEPESVPPATEPSNSGGTGNSDTGTESEFPMTDDAFNVVEVGEGSLV